MKYRPDPPTEMVDMLLFAGAGPEPEFDAVMGEFLAQSYAEMQQFRRRGSLLTFASLGQRHPWLYRLQFATRGLIRNQGEFDGEVRATNRHIVAVRFLADYLRNADRFAMLRLVEPSDSIFHPNISPAGAICIEIYPGEPLSEICHALHDLFRWRLRQYDERDALNPIACAWGRQHVHTPLDDRPLVGRKAAPIQWQSVAAEPEA